MSSTTIRSDFDVASQPGLREKLDQIYRSFREQQQEHEVIHARQNMAENAQIARTACPMCNKESAHSTPLFTKNHVSHVQCQQCTLTYTLETLNPEMDSALYDNTLFSRSYAQLKKNPLYANLEINKARYLIQQAKNWSLDGTTILDIGANTGAVMHAASEQGMTSYGVEPDTIMAPYLSETYPDNFVCGFYPQAVPTHWPTFDVITLLDVLEHMVHPIPFLQTIKSSLGKNGILVVQTPNLHSLLIQLQGKDSSNFCTGHWLHFTASTMKDMLTLAGFRQLETGNIISEADRIRAFPQQEIEATFTRLTGKPLMNLTPEYLYSHGLGYKIYGIFTPI